MSSKEFDILRIVTGEGTVQYKTDLAKNMASQHSKCRGIRATMLNNYVIW